MYHRETWELAQITVLKMGEMCIIWDPHYNTNPDIAAATMHAFDFVNASQTSSAGKFHKGLQRFS